MLELHLADLGVRQTVYDAAGLARVAQGLLVDGPRLRTPDGGDRAALLWLAELAAHRSDWREAVVQACLKIAETPVGLAAVWQMLAEAPAALLLVDVAERLQRERETSDQQRATAEKLRGQRDLRVRRPLPLPLPGRLFVLADPVQVPELLNYLLDRLDGLTPRPGLDGWQTLWMLRDVELTQPWTREPLAQALQAQLVGEDAEHRAAVVEYLAVSGDLATRIPMLEAVLQQGGPVLDQPVGELPCGLALRDLLEPHLRGEALGEVIAALIAVGASQRSPAIDA